MNDQFHQPSNQPPYDHQRYAQYATEPWDDGHRAHQATPRVWYYFLAFVVGMMLMGSLLVFVGFFCHTNPQAMLDAQAQSTTANKMTSIDEVKLAAKVYAIIGLLYVFAGALVFAMPRNMMLWSYGIALMALAAMSFCYAPFSVAMFIFWMLPNTRAYFRR